MFGFRKIFGVLIVSVILLSCSKSGGYKAKLNIPYKNLEPQEVEIVEYNKVLFAIDTADFEAGIKALAPQFEPLLGDTLNEDFVMYLKEFVTDTFILKINSLVNETFPDIEAVAKDVKYVYQHVKYYYPEYTIPTTYSYVSGIYHDKPHLINDDYILLGLDFYLSNKDYVYDRIGFPRYMSRRCQPAYLTRDLAEAFYNSFITKQINQKNVLAEMIEHGKKLYFVEAMDPRLQDSVIMGYSSSQMQWARDNEGEVWASVVGNEMLYANNYDSKRLLFGDGPFTAPFGEEAPARLGEYLGLQIVRSFMSNNDVTLIELMNMTDCQDVLQRSQYKPRK